MPSDTHAPETRPLDLEAIRAGQAVIDEWIQSDPNDLLSVDMLAKVAGASIHVHALLAELDRLRQRVERLEAMLHNAKQRLASEYMLNDPRPLLARITAVLEDK